jgi:capsid protein
MTRRHHGAANILDQFAELKNDYNISKPSRYKTKKRGMMTLGSHADYHYRSESAYFGAMELAREMCRNNPLVVQGVRRLIANVVGRGFVLDADSGDAGIDEVNGYRWEEWTQHADQCDDQQEMDFHQMEHLTLMQAIIDGDMCSLPNVDGGIESQEAHRLKTPRNTKKNVVHGVELDDRRRRQRYWFTNEDVSPMTPISRVGDVTQIDARDRDGRRQVFHHYLPDRRSQTRGVTAFAPMADTADHWDDLQFAQLVGAKIQSCYTILRELSPNAPALPMIGDGDHSETDEQRPDGQTRTLTDVAPGFEIYGWPGESLKGFTPTIPGQQFFQHSKLLLGILAVNLDLPLVVFMLDASETNYSGFRGAIDQARQRWREIQTWYQGSFHRPVYKWKVRQWATRDAALRKAIQRADEVKASLGYLPANEINPFAHVWHAQELPYIQPVDDATADILQTKGLLTSPRRIAASRGQDFNDLTREIVEDHGQRIELAHAKAEELNKRLNLDPPIHWREILSWPMPDGVQVMASKPAPANGNGEPVQPANGQNRLAALMKTRGNHAE